MLILDSSSSVSEVRSTRVLIFNCTSGRSGDEFLKVILQKTEERLAQYGSPEKKEDFFAKVIFCSNVTYASGNFKGGESDAPSQMQAYVCI
jgi:folylpolyglutamate synthase